MELKVSERHSGVVIMGTSTGSAALYRRVQVISNDTNG